MTGEHVAAGLLQPGDVIRVRHHHDAPSAKCLACWETDAVVTDDPVGVFGRTAIRWAGHPRIGGGQAGVTGISLFLPGEPALRLGRLPVTGQLTAHVVIGRGRGVRPNVPMIWPRSSRRGGLIVTTQAGSCPA
jgi:hypothetical protein